MNDLYENYYKDFDMVILPQPRGHIEYPWPGLIIFNKIKKKDQISFSSGLFEGESCDTGGEMYYYIKNNKKSSYKICNYNNKARASFFFNNKS